MPPVAACLNCSSTSQFCATSSSRLSCLICQLLKSVGLLCMWRTMYMTHWLTCIFRHFDISRVCRAHNGTQVQESSHTMSPRSQGATPPKPPSGSPMHAYTNPAFCPAFVSRIPKPAPLHPPRKPGDPKQISAHFKRNLRSPRLPLEQSQHNFQDPKQPAAPPKSDARDPLHPLEELPSTSQMQPAVPAMPAAFEPHSLGALQHAGEEGGDRAQQASAERLADAQHCPVSPSHLFHQPGHAVVSVVYEDAVQSNHLQKHVVGVLPAGDDAETSTQALHAGPHTFKHMRAVQQEGEVDDWDEPSFGDMCRRLVAVIEVYQVAAATSLESALFHSSPCGSSSGSCSSSCAILFALLLMTFRRSSCCSTREISMLQVTLPQSSIFLFPLFPVTAQLRAISTSISFAIYT